MSSSGAPGSPEFDVNITERKWTVSPQYFPSPGDGLEIAFLVGEEYSYNINIQAASGFEEFYKYWYTWVADSTVVEDDLLWTQVYGTFAMGDGNDTITNAIGGPGVTSLSGYFLGGPGDDLITTQDPTYFNTAFIYGGSGADTIGGTDADDLLYGDEVDYFSLWPTTSGFTPAIYVLSSLGGADSIDGGFGSDTLVGGGGNDTLTGGGDNDSITSDSGDSQLLGGDGADTLVGGIGNDFLYGGPRGAGFLDVLSGGGGADVFMLSYTDGNDTNSSSGAEFWTGYFAANAVTITGDAVQSTLADWFKGEAKDLTTGFLGAALGGAGATLLTDLFGWLLSLSPVATPEEDILVIRDFDPSQDVLVLPTSTGVDLTGTPGAFAPDPAGDSGQGITFTNNSTKYAELTLSDDFLASLGLSQDSDPSIIDSILQFLLDRPTRIVAGAQFDSLSSLAESLPGGTFDPPSDYGVPAGTSVDLYGAIGGLVYRGESGGAGSPFIVGTVYADILTRNPVIRLAEDYYADSAIMTDLGSVVHGLGADDLIYGTNGSDDLYGGDGNDILYSFRAGSEGEDLYGGAGDDTIYGGGSYGNFDGGDGVDTFGVLYIADELADARTVMQLYVDLKNNVAGERALSDDVDLSAPVSADRPFIAADSSTYALSGFENVIGGPLNDWIRMMAGGTVEGGAGADYIDATAGGVTFSYASAGVLLDSPVLVQLFFTDAVTSGGDAEGDVLNFEGSAPAGLIGSGSADTLGGTASATDGFTFTGGGGADLFQVLSVRNGEVYTITDFSPADGDLIDLRPVGIAASQVQLGSSGVTIFTPDGGTASVVLENFTGTLTTQDVRFATAVSGAARADIGGGALSGGEGNDVLKGRGSQNFLNGNGGDDTAIGDSGVDMLDGGRGRDVLRGNGGDDRLSGGDDDDQLFGGEGDDRLIGGAGNDSLWGGGGGDLILAGAGDDVVRTGSGGDTARGEAGDDILIGGDGRDQLFGDDGADTLNGSLGHDEMFGGAGSDILMGDAGDDTLEGGAGGDMMRGGLGADLFRLVFGFAAGDSILDFNAAEGDRLVVESDHPIGVSHLGGRRFAITDGFTTEILQVKGATQADFDILIG
ncbi:hypothetical protein [Roseomonas sp. AR75]|uniref:calcium-binding protein n=1 Tax=Roseomonas sp. AR75 TaxID=2562311 RepID=UPI0010BFFC15|nr:hypothetical protein [Roseomonas sp. AR75]